MFLNLTNFTYENSKKKKILFCKKLDNLYELLSPYPYPSTAASSHSVSAREPGGDTSNRVNVSHRFTGAAAPTNHI